MVVGFRDFVTAATAVASGPPEGFLRGNGHLVVEPGSISRHHGPEFRAANIGVNGTG